MRLLPPWLVVLMVWAAIYLPALGSFEIKSEEGRRILPAMAMMESGNYLVPQIGSDTYFSKPPLVNWLVAASFKLFGIRTEWTARLPSVLAVLGVAVAFLTVGRASLGLTGSAIAAIVWLTTLGIIEKGRLIEIEAVYVSLSAIATICWLSWWLGKRSAWLTWTVPWIWLGLGWLAKGPVHLIFFYAVVVAVLWRTKQLKALLHPAHFVGVALMLGMFAAWAIPFLQASGQSRGLTKWSSQFTGRSSLEYFNLRALFSTLVRAIGQFLPWLIFVPFIRFSRFADDNEKPLAKAIAWSALLPVLIVSLFPVSAARYSLPAAAPFCWLMASAFCGNAFALIRSPAPTGLTMWNRVGLPLALVIALGASIAFPVRAHLRSKGNKVKNVAEEVNRVVPAGQTLYAIDPGYQPFLFYVKAHIKYVDAAEQLPVRARYLLVREPRGGKDPNIEKAIPNAKVIGRITDYRGETVTVFERPSS